MGSCLEAFIFGEPFAWLDDDEFDDLDTLGIRPLFQSMYHKSSKRHYDFLQTYNRKSVYICSHGEKCDARILIRLADGRGYMIGKHTCSGEELSTLHHFKYIIKKQDEVIKRYGGEIGFKKKEKENKLLAKKFDMMVRRYNLMKARVEKAAIQNKKLLTVIREYESALGIDEENRIVKTRKEKKTEETEGEGEEEEVKKMGSPKKKNDSGQKELKESQTTRKRKENTT